ncbi:hypothetical protein SAMN04488121_10847, partial [Chitinophaga filiformis]
MPFSQRVYSREIRGLFPRGIPDVYCPGGPGHLFRGVITPGYKQWDS